MIPIRDRYRRITGFTARDMSEDKKVAKYLNPIESDIYHKKTASSALTSLSGRPPKKTSSTSWRADPMPCSCNAFG